MVVYKFDRFIENIDPEATHTQIQTANFTPDSLWVRRCTNITVKGQTIFYTCKAAKKCPSRLQLIIDSVAQNASILISDDSHVHELGEEDVTDKHGIKDSTKEIILDFEKKHMKVCDLI